MTISADVLAQRRITLSGKGYEAKGSFHTDDGVAVPATDGLRRATTLAFMTLAFTPVLHAFSTRSKTQSILSSSLYTNRWLWAATATCVLLHPVAPTVPEWGVIAGCSLLPVIAVELVKVIYRTPWYQASRNALGND